MGSATHVGLRNADDLIGIGLWIAKFLFYTQSVKFCLHGLCVVDSGGAAGKS